MSTNSEQRNGSYDAGAARVAFSELLSRAQYGGERVVVFRRGRPVAALVPLSDLDKLTGVTNHPTGALSRTDDPPVSAA
jgi:prevent-host-death family protein